MAWSKLSFDTKHQGKLRNTPINSDVTNYANKTNISAKPIQVALNYCVTNLSEAFTADSNTAFQILVYFYTQRYSFTFMTSLNLSLNKYP